jgi:hypothetical protein
MLWLLAANHSIHRTEAQVRRFLAIAALTAIPLFGSACASSGTPANRTNESSPDRVTSVEIEATAGASNAYDLVRRLRPRWLTGGGVSSIGRSQIEGQVLLVYLDGNKLGSVEALRTLTVSGIKSMQYYDAVRAATVLRDVGSQPISGAIAINTR